MRTAFSELPYLFPLVTLIIVYIAASLFVPNFATMRTSGIVTSATITGIVTIGITLLMITGEFDLSIGSIFAAGGYIFGTMVVGGYSPSLLLALPSSFQRC
ncbi:MAG: hypothetical protein R2880_09755 [Deinococcales bacterium]